MLKNPFSFYDFLGYLFPGLLCVMFVKVICSMDGAVTIPDFYSKGIEGSIAWNDTIPYTVLAYVVGHFISYFSSLTVEPFLIWSYGYPSVFLLNDNYDKRFFAVNETLGKGWTIFWKILVCVFIFPIALASLFFGKWLRFRVYVLKPLDSYLKESIRKKMRLLSQYLSLPSMDEGKDIHRIIMHYCYENYRNHIPKYDNYVALYGFLRSLSFLSSSLFIYCFWIELRTIDLYSSIDWLAIIALTLLFCVTYVFYLGFVKFYRRYTLENLMSITVDPNLRD
ncbi:hypothetical protein D7V92_17935 [Parabacteroides sp. CH2-D42-20]|uniref:hypothetical protein n=1 Tax=unclassified Parabacteroides TaxID=2649774 RepID=UPI000EF74E1F|nr:MULTISPECIES: hypothetical protein [unclassified Parabacteroides]MDO5430564.1 hypothetical protein [Parabacteroides sp.]RLT68213.1 hypothetical protein D7V92_17935 [Parabacteroides sp. CH2-D42-20]